MSIRMKIPERVRAFFSKGDSLTLLVKKNIFGSFFLRGVSILVTLMLVPLTIDYVNSVQYGIWLSLSSIMQWFAFFDIGLAMGLRNRFAEAKATNDTEKARQYISTAYAAILCMALLLVVITIPLCDVVDWTSVLNVTEDYRSELSVVMTITMAFFALNLVVAIMSNILIGDQLVAISSLIGVIGQLTTLVVIWIMVHTQGHGTLIQLAWFLAGIPPTVWTLSTIVLFVTRYRKYSPSPSKIRPSLIGDLLGIGGKFFVITVSMLMIFQLMNVIISRELGPSTVTEYNVAWRYFNTVFMVSAIILAPFWTATTAAYTRGDMGWIMTKVRRLEKMLLTCLIPGLTFMLIVSQVVYHLWVGDKVEVSWTTSVSLAVYMCILCVSNVYSCIINGTGKVQMQLWIYLGFALMAFPVMSLLCRKFGIPGLLMLPTLIYVIQALVMRTQLMKILNKKATGIWNK